MSRRRVFRSGFTLIEILMVIAILALLTSLVIVSVKGVVGNAKLAATKGTIRKIDALLTKRIEAFQRYVQEQDQLSAKKGTLPYPYRPRDAGDRTRRLAWYQEDLKAMLPQGTSPNQAIAAGKVLAKEDFFRRYFPQSVAEVDQNEFPFPAGFDSSKTQAVTESSAMLYYMLTSMPGLTVDAVEIDQFKSGEIADTDGDGLMEFVDGWGNPLRFYRWPTRLVRPAPSPSLPAELQSVTVVSGEPHEKWSYLHPVVNTYGGTSGAGPRLLLGDYAAPNSGVTRGAGTTLGQEHADPLARDSDDSIGILHPNEEKSAPLMAQRLENAAAYSGRTPRFYYRTGSTWSTPLIVSAGIDERLGLFEPTSTTNFGHLCQPDVNNLESLLDNVTNRNLRVGGN